MAEGRRQSTEGKVERSQTEQVGVQMVLAMKLHFERPISTRGREACSEKLKAGIRRGKEAENAARPSRSSWVSRVQVGGRRSHGTSHTEAISPPISLPIFSVNHREVKMGNFGKPGNFNFSILWLK